MSKSTLELVLQALNTKYEAISHQTIASSGTAQSLTVPDFAGYALIAVEGATSADGVRIWMDGTAPTSTVGIPRFNGSVFDVTGNQNIKNLKFISAGAGGTLSVQYFK